MISIIFLILLITPHIAKEIPSFYNYVTSPTDWIVICIQSIYTEAHIFQVVPVG